MYINEKKEKKDISVSFKSISSGILLKYAMWPSNNQWGHALVRNLFYDKTVLKETQWSVQKEQYGMSGCGKHAHISFFLKN